MDIQLISLDSNSPVSQATLRAATAHNWSIQIHTPDGTEIDCLPPCSFYLVVVDAGDKKCFDRFAVWYRSQPGRMSRIVKFIAFDTTYDPQKALAVAGRYDVEYALLPESGQALYDYLYTAAGCGDNFYEIARSLSSSVYSEIIDNYALTSVTDPRGVITNVNQRFVEISGYSREELIGNKHSMLKSGKHSPEFYTEIWRTISSGNCWRGNICNRAKNGDNYWVDSFIFPVKDASNKIRFFVSFRYDITEEIEMKERLIVRDERVRLSHDYANVGTWDWNITTGDLYWSEEIHKLFGYEKPVLKTTYANFIQAIHPDDRELVISRVNDSVNYGTPYSVEHRVIHPNGNVRWLAERGHVLRNEQGKPVRMLGVVSDIHELIEAKKDAVDAEQVKSTFISTLSHEIRNPLNAIAGFSSIIADKVQDSEVCQYTKKIEAIVDHMSGILEDINLNNKLESGNISHRKKPVNLSKIIDESIEIVLANPTSITITKQDIAGWVLADEQHLRQVLINLLSNAIKYNRDDGSVYIRTLPGCKNQIRIEIEDTGFGIAKNSIEKLFKPYERLKWTKSEVDGLGLGLPICKGLIESMSGSIGVDSQKNRGSTFWIELSECYARKKNESRTVSEVSELEQYLPLRILLLDDNEFNLEFMKVQLEGYGISVDAVEDGKQGLDKINENRYDLVITDINMPTIDGREMIRRIQRSYDKEIRLTPIIVVTAGSDIQDDCASLGASVCLTKPVKKEALVAALIKALHQKQIDPACTCDPIIDEKALRHHLGNSSEKVIKLLKIFLESLKKEFPILLQASDRNDRDTLGEICHKIKSPARSVGATRLANLLENLEEAAGNPDRENIQVLINQIDTTQRATVEVVQGIIDANQTSILSEEHAAHISSDDPPQSDGRFSVLVIDDDDFSIKQLEQVLDDFDSLQFSTTTDPRKGLEILERKDIDLLILDINMPEIDGIQLIRRLADIGKSPSIILYSNELSVIHSTSELVTSYGLEYVGALEKPCSRLSVSRMLKSYRKSNSKSADLCSPVSDEIIEYCIDNEHVLVVYQPQVSTKKSRVNAVEALSRLIDKDSNIIAPYDFLSRLDKLGLEYTFSSIVANKAIMQLAQWQAQGIDLKMAINFSMNVLEDIALPEKLKGICDHYRVSPNKIIVEVTETVLSARPKLASEVLVRLKLAGFNLSVDDFGTGYSSLEKLQKLPFSEIKLDRSYVSNASTDDISLALLKSSINLANQLNMVTVAEGVETQQDFDLAVKSGVDLIQGFYFTEPLLPDSLKDWLDEFHHSR